MPEINESELRQLFDNARPGKRDSATWYERAKIALGAVFTLCTTFVGWYFTWTQHEHERLAKELEFTKTVAEVPELGLDRAEASMALIESLSDEDVYRRIVATLPVERRVALLSRSISRAIVSNDSRSIERALSVIRPSQFVPNEADLDRLPLEQAVDRGDLRLVQFLIARGFAPAAEDIVMGARFQRGALGAAIEHSDVGMINLLLANGAHAERPGGGDGIFPLHRAVRSANPQVVQALLAHRVNVDEPDSEGRSPLVVVLERRWSYSAGSETTLEIAKMLLEAGADPNGVAKSDFREVTKPKLWPLALVAGSKDVETFQLLISKGASLVGPSGANIGRQVVQYGSKEVLHALLSVHGKPGELTKDDLSELLIDANSDEMVRALAGAGARFGNRPGGSELVWWIERLRDEKPVDEVSLISMLRTARDLGAEIDATGNYGYTPLCRSAKNGLPRVVSFLLEAGAYTHARCGEDKSTAMEFAASYCHDTVVAVLLASGKDDTSSSDRRKLAKKVNDRRDVFKNRQDECSTTIALLEGAQDAKQVADLIRTSGSP